MGLIMNLLLSLLFSVALVHSDQSTVSLKSFKINNKVTYDCIDIQKQPGLDHPLLKNHKIQMKPSILRTEPKNQTRSNNKTYESKIKCPYGTVPILRTTKEFNSSTNLFAEKYFHPLSGDSPRTHIAGVRSSTGPYHGVEALFNSYIIGSVEPDQAAYTQIYIGSGLNNEVNFMQTGMMRNPSLYGDSNLWSYGFWRGKNGQECYNTACPGFVQVSREVSVAERINTRPGEFVWLRREIYQDKETGNWLVTNVMPDVFIGYWPKEIFNLMVNGANMVGVGGVVEASRFGPSPPMGNGKFPIGIDDSATFQNIKILSCNYEVNDIDVFPVENLLDSPKCYGLQIGTDPRYRETRGFFFNYGGPGGDSCGL